MKQENTFNQTPDYAHLLASRRAVSVVEGLDQKFISNPAGNKDILFSLKAFLD